MLKINRDGHYVVELHDSAETVLVINIFLNAIEPSILMM